METAKVTLLFKPSGSIRTWRKEESLGTTMSTCKNLLLSLDRSCFQVVWLPGIFTLFYKFFIFQRYRENGEVRKIMRLRSSSALKSNIISSFLSDFA
jgi:hypothetical protein